MVVKFQGDSYGSFGDTVMNASMVNHIYVYKDLKTIIIKSVNVACFSISLKILRIVC